LNRVKSFFLLKDIRLTGPPKYLLLGFSRLRMTIPALCGNCDENKDLEVVWRATRATSKRAMSPFILYLYLKPLYSMRGGSTTRADPFAKKLTVVDLRWNPLYKWNSFTHLILVLSAMNTHDSLNNICSFDKVVDHNYTRE